MCSPRLHGWIAAAAALFLASSARALTPDDIVVLFNTNSPNSLGVARYYMNARKIPANHLLPIQCDGAETISEELYRAKIVPQIKSGLEQHNLSASVKCLVTTYGIPLKILSRQSSPAELREIAGFRSQMQSVLETLDNQIAAYDAILPAPPAPPATAPAAIAGPATAPASQPRSLQSLAPRLNAAASGAANRIGRAAEPMHNKAMLEFLSLHERVVGISGILSSMRVSPDAPNAQSGQARLNELSAQLREMDQQYQNLSSQRDQPQVRRQMVDLHRKSAGLVGEARALEEMIAFMQPDNTGACFDNELALILADQNYLRNNWLPNPKNIETYSQTQRALYGTLPRTLMVARLDGHTAAKVQEMIDTTLKVEAAGLQGKLYLDTRGLRGADAYGLFDGELRRTAQWLREHSTIEVVLDDKPELLLAKDAPDAALYCGWYSLHNYQESAQWVKGAVGYHVASSEMLSLHDPKETGWVINLLDRGFCGTLGPTDEPYLNAFPNPSLFFPLLLSGQFTQGEVWQVTCPLLSWQIGYVGDPLYNPFKTNPKVSIDEIKSHPILRNAFPLLRDNPPPTQPPQ